MATCRGLLILITLVVMATLFYGNQADQSSYWQSYVSSDADRKKEHQKGICFPNQTSTRQELGNIISKNTSSVCVSNTLVVYKIDSSGWRADFKVNKKVIRVVILSSYTNLQAAQLRKFVLFISRSKLDSNHNYKHYKSQVEECTRYVGRGFKAKEEMTFNCDKVVHGRYFYIWNLGARKLSSVAIRKVEFEFAIEVKVNPSDGWTPDTGQHAKNFKLFFKYLNNWSDKTPKGFWMVTLGRIETVKALYIGISAMTLRVMTGMTVDVGTLNSKGEASYRGNKKTVLSADKKDFFVEGVHIRGDSVRLKSSNGSGQLEDSSVTYIELLTDIMNYMSEVKVERGTKKETSVRRQCLKGELQAWQDNRLQATGWIMVDMGKRYMVKAVGVRTCRNTNVIKDLQGLVIATSNIVPAGSLSQVEGDICAAVGEKVKIVPGIETNFRCLPKPTLGAFVMLYNKLKPMRLYAIRYVKVYISIDIDIYFRFKVPRFQRVPPRPPKTNIPIAAFFVLTQIKHSTSFGYWVLDMQGAKRINALMVTAGSATTNLKSFTIYVQDAFVVDLNEVCARFMSASFRPGTKKFLICTPRPKKGKYVILAFSYHGFNRDAIKSVEVRFVYKDKKQYATPNMPTSSLPKASQNSALEHKIDWNVLYQSFRYSNNPKGWWVFDLGKRYIVIEVALKLKYNHELLRDFRIVYVGLSNDRDDRKPQVCAYYVNKRQLTPSQAAYFSFHCSSRYTFRFVLFRSHQGCSMFPLGVLKNIKIMVSKGDSYVYAKLDMTTSFQATPQPTESWKRAPFGEWYQKLQDKFPEGVTIRYKFSSPITLISLRITLHGETNVSAIRVLMNNDGNIDNGYKTCYWLQLQKAEAFYAGSSYKIKCGYRKEAFKYIFTYIKDFTYVNRLLFNFKSSNRYYYYKYKGSQPYFTKFLAPYLTRRTTSPSGIH